MTNLDMTIALSKARTAKAASKIYSELRDASGEGASTFPEGRWKGNRISYNGKVWFGQAPWTSGEAPIFNPYA